MSCFELAAGVLTIPSLHGLAVSFGDPETYLDLRGSGRIVVELLDAGEPLEGVIAFLSEQTGTDAAQVADDVTSFVTELVELGVLTEVVSPPSPRPRWG